MRHDAADYYYHTRVRHGPSGLYNTVAYRRRGSRLTIIPYRKMKACR